MVPVLPEFRSSDTLECARCSVIRGNVQLKQKTLPEKQTQKLVEYWRVGSQDDQETARAVAAGTKRFHAALFYAHLAVEKALKAQFVRTQLIHAPYTHNLLHLVAKIGWELGEEEAQRS
jgi:hypothetical protein